MSANEQSTAVLAALTTALSPKVPYLLHAVPSPRPSEYVAVVVSRRFGGNLNLGAQMGITGYRISVEAVSEQSGTNAAVSLEKCRAALEFVRLTVGGKSTTPIQYEAETPIDYDDGWFSGVMQFTYTV